MVAEQDGDGEGAVEPLQNGRDRLLGLLPCSSWWSIRWATTSLSVSSGSPAGGLHLLAQRPEILDDAVVDERDAADDVRVGVADGRSAVGRPARMGDPDRPGERMGGELGGEIVELALGPAALEPAVDDRADAGRVIAAIFEPPQPLHEPLGDFLASDDADDSAHVLNCPSIRAFAFAQSLLRMSGIAQPLILSSRGALRRRLRRRSG
jgi:hypothetical protein